MPLASVLMQRSIMLPFAVALAALACCFPTLAAVRGKKVEEDRAGEEATTGLLEDAGGEHGAPINIATARPRTTVPNTIKGALRYLRQVDVNIFLVLLGHLICPVRQELVFQILIPYTSKRFNLPIAKVHSLPFSLSYLGILTLQRLASSFLLSP
jgi:hypothetical protein